MPKRRRDDFGQEREQPGDRAISQQRAHLAHEIDYGKKTLHGALKIARGFERQKLGRRQKTAKDRQDAADGARLETEVLALKRLDLPTVAEVHLHKTLLKSKSIASVPALPSEIASSIDRARDLNDPPSINVRARLYNSNPVKTAMADIMQRIRLILGLEDAEISRSKRAKTDARGLKASNEKGLRGAIDATGPERAPPSSGSRDRPSSSPEWTGFSDDQSVADKHDDEEEDFPAYNARIAPSDSESEVATPTESYTEEFRNMLAIPSADTSLSRSTSPSSTSPPSKTHKSNVVSSRSNSTFIPSLMGGYWSGSESAEEDDLTEGKARKNRRGQQARRQLWEKKYGRKANHLSSKNRDQDWDSRNGARSSDDRGKRGRGRGRGYERGPVPNQRSNDGGHGSGANSNPVVARVRAKKEDGPLHPSWEAAKKAKEQKKNVAFQGKKVVFD